MHFKLFSQLNFYLSFLPLKLLYFLQALKEQFKSTEKLGMGLQRLCKNKFALVDIFVNPNNRAVFSFDLVGPTKADATQGYPLIACYPMDQKSFDKIMDTHRIGQLPQNVKDYNYNDLNQLNIIRPQEVEIAGVPTVESLKEYQIPFFTGKDINNIDTDTGMSTEDN